MSQPQWYQQNQPFVPYQQPQNGYGTVPPQSYNNYQNPQYYNQQYVIPQQQQQQPIPPQYMPDQYSQKYDNGNQQLITTSNIENERFNYKESKYRDVIWAIIFIIQLSSIILLSILYYNKHSNEFKNDSTSFVNKNFWKLSIAVTLISIGCSLLWIFFIKSFSYYLIWFSLFLSLAMWIIFGIACLMASSLIGAIICFLFTIIQIIWMYSVRNRIKFASTILKISIGAVNEMPSNYLISFLSIILQTCWMIIWLTGISFIIYNTQKANQNNNSNNNYNNGLLALFMFSFYWTTQVIANIVHVTTCGSVATWYFFSPNNTMKNPVWNSFKRSITTSFGSICFGSFIIAVIQTLRFLVQKARESDNTFLRACAECLLNCIENLVNYFNLYAFALIAIYGYSYCNSAKQTWNLLKSKGLDMIINDDLIDGVLFLSCLFAGALSAGITMCLSKWIFDIGDWDIWTAIGFVIGFGLTLCAIVVVKSGVVTLFVCFADDPAALSMTKPYLYDELANAWRQRYGELPARLTNPNPHPI